MDSGFSYKVSLPEKIQVIEGVIENASTIRSKSKNPFAVTEGFCLVYSPIGCPIAGLDDSQQTTRELDWKNDPRDARVLRRLVEKSIDIGIRNLTKCPALNELYMLDSPLNLFDTEKAKLYSGFTTKVRFSDGKDAIIVDFFPDARILESVFDFVKWHRSRGASANSIENCLTERRANNVSVSPLGKMGVIKGVIWSKAGETKTSMNDSRTLVEYWNEIYGVEIDPSEIPLLRIQPYESSSIFTYPPSAVFFDEKVLGIGRDLKRTLEYRKNSASSRTRSIADEVLSNLKLGDLELWQVGNNNAPSFVSDPGVQIFAEIEKALCGRSLRARGQVVKFGEGMFFLPDSILEVN